MLCLCHRILPEVDQKARPKHVGELTTYKKVLFINSGLNICKNKKRTTILVLCCLPVPEAGRTKT